MEGRRWIMKTAWLLMATLAAVSAQGGVNIGGNCAAMTCSGGETCRETFVEIFRAVIAQCYGEPPGDADACTPGEPLLIFNVQADAIEVYNCDGRECPTGYTCSAGDVCCPDAPKERDCPSPSDLNSNGDDCGSILCNNDHNCEDADKCCTDLCGGTVCTNPAIIPGDPAPGDRVGVCPTPRCTWPQVTRTCNKECFSDSDCSGNQKCCVDYHRCGSSCQDPEPSSNCGNTICPDGQWCHMVSPIGCIPTSSNTCFAAPQCISIANACGRNCRCELHWNHSRRTIEPTCVSDQVRGRGSWSHGD